MLRRNTVCRSTSQEEKRTQATGGSTELQTSEGDSLAQEERTLEKEI